MGRGTPDEIDGRKIICIYQMGFPITTPEEDALEQTANAALADYPNTDVMLSEIYHSPELDENGEMLGTVYLADKLTDPEPE